MNTLVTAALLIVAAIHLLPAVGVLGSERLLVLYGVDFKEANSLLLMRHRAVLFGIVGGFILFAAFRPGLQWAAIIMAAVSTLSFIALALGAPAHNEQLGKVVLVDVVAIAALLVAIGVRLLRSG